MKKLGEMLLFFIILTFLLTSSVRAQSGYVLPYPSSMPGSSVYKVHLVWEKIMEFWYFGSLAQFEYNLKQSDKYLVESKTLFEYKQYLLGFKALEKSNHYFKQSVPRLEMAKSEGKNVELKEDLFQQAAKKHIEEIEKILANTPEVFVWSPEKEDPSTLEIHKLIKKSINIRKNAL
ncbi:hypothetical protein C4577_06150 [Candidatus Parcubacteria bacterium]|nr:MAG: hypothetical protein C4577_06150 [Candidatus Parcubacteria bacterium]